MAIRIGGAVSLKVYARDDHPAMGREFHRGMKVKAEELGNIAARWHGNAGIASQFD
ncbi:hypothetical protein [Pseudaminobacter soli (ex Li et al. 2025)]|uniref:hypothetical protein n=1 Tax=Pseudaminobacter soli (ex Li et al. 2025) TaxID=1295366 RepID=UPI0015E7134F|nr:hypothetical protein [Mesorhizobium soli]